jgi:hypothetical protein
MRRSDANHLFTDVQQITDRLMIDLFKQKRNDLNRSPSHLKGSWSEAGDLLITHFGNVSRIVNQNRSGLHDLYKAAVWELEQSFL